MKTHQLIKYRLTPEGTIPDFVYKSNDGFSGLYPVVDINTNSPQDNILLGLTEYSVSVNTPGVVGILTTKQELENYLTVILENSFEPGDKPDERNPVNIESRVNRLWGIYENKD